jgi:hypothetical protein
MHPLSHFAGIRPLAGCADAAGGAAAVMAVAVPVAGRTLSGTARVTRLPLWVAPSVPAVADGGLPAARVGRSVRMSRWERGRACTCWACHDGEDGPFGGAARADELTARQQTHVADRIAEGGCYPRRIGGTTGARRPFTTSRIRRAMRRPQRPMREGSTGPAVSTKEKLN